MKNILEDLEILILQNEDDFDRGSGKFILRNFIKEKQAEQLTLTDVSQRSELLAFIEEVSEFDALVSSTRLRLRAKELLKANCG
jgi:hypothetical protein